MSDELDRFLKLMPRSRDLTLIVLKGHLLVEEAVNDLLSTLLKNPEALRQATLSFYQRLKLLQALGFVSDRELSSAEKLNNLRNRFAHTLEPQDTEVLIRRFLADWESDEVAEYEWEQKSIQVRLKNCLSYLVASLYGVRKGVLTVKELEAQEREARKTKRGD